MAATRPCRADYKWFTDITTRWMDNDVYGHINNVIYYSYFDSAVNRYLIAAGGLAIHDDAVIGLVVESQCRYHAPIAFPQHICAGLRVDRLDQRAVTYGIAIFADDEVEAAAHGHFVHVFVNRRCGQPTTIPEQLRNALNAIRQA